MEIQASHQVLRGSVEDQNKAIALGCMENLTNEQAWICGVVES